MDRYSDKGGKKGKDCLIKKTEKMYETEFFQEWEDFKKSDRYHEEAYEEIYNLFDEKKENIYFKRQLQVKYEKKYFHWTTSNALNRLENEGHLKSIKKEKKDRTSRQYFIHPSNRYFRRKMNEYEKIVDEYSESNISKSCGYSAERLFAIALMEKKFELVKKETKEFGDKKWEETGHNLDFVFKRNGVFWGCEIKNTFDYIKNIELKIKLRMCEFFGIRPLFIMRHAPKVYIEEIRKKGGFGLIFEAKIFDISQEKMVRKIREKLEMPVDCPKSIPEGIINRFMKWLDKEKL